MPFDDHLRYNGAPSFRKKKKRKRENSRNIARPLSKRASILISVLVRPYCRVLLLSDSHGRRGGGMDCERVFSAAAYEARQQSHRRPFRRRLRFLPPRAPAEYRGSHRFPLLARCFLPRAVRLRLQENNCRNPGRNVSRDVNDSPPAGCHGLTELCTLLAISHAFYPIPHTLS